MTSMNEQPNVAERMDQLEERLAHLLRANDDLSEVVARQDKSIELLERRVAMLLQREAERYAAEGDGGAVFIDRPPHY